MRISSPFYLMALITLRDPDWNTEFSIALCQLQSAISFSTSKEEASTAITPNQALFVIFKAHSFSLEDIVFPAHTSSADVRLKMFF